MGNRMSAIPQVASIHWTTVINFILHQHFPDSVSICMLSHTKFKVELQLPILILEPLTWNATLHDAAHSAKRKEFSNRCISNNDWILKLTVAIEQAHCETFIAFQEHIPLFARNFYNASIYSAWRSSSTRFIFAYADELLQGANTSNYFDGYIFHDQPYILLVTAHFLNDSIFDIKTNTFVGTRYFGEAPKPATFDLIQQYDAVRLKLLWHADFSLKHKLMDLQGRELVIGIFDYKPFMVLDYDEQKQPLYHDRAENKQANDVFIDGTEVRIMLQFCEMRNCQVQVDTSEQDWGVVYPNATGLGLLGMAMARRSDYGIGGIYLWYEAYQNLQMTHFLGRSGVTCLVPAPQRLINWALPLRPFQATLWLCMVAYVLLECGALCCARRWERIEATSEWANSWQQSIRYGFISALKLLLNQSTNYRTSSYSLRTVLFASYLIDIIITTIYGGGLAAILTLPSYEEPIDTRLRLYQSQIIWTGTSEAWIMIFDFASDPILRGISQQFRVFDAAQIEIYSLTERMAFVVERMQFGNLGNAERIPDNALTRLKLMQEDIYFAYTVAFVPRLWPYLDDFNKFILAWHSSGFDKHWEWKVAADYMNVMRQNRIFASQKIHVEKGPVQLGIDNFMGLIMLWCFGLLCSMLVFIGELCCIKLKMSANGVYPDVT